MIRIIPAAAALLLLFLPVFTHAQNKAPAEMPLEAVQRVARQVMSAEPRLRKAALEALAERGDPDVVPALIQALRFFPDEGAINATLVALVGERPGTEWNDWMLWQEGRDRPPATCRARSRHVEWINAK